MIVARVLRYSCPANPIGTLYADAQMARSVRRAENAAARRQLMFRWLRISGMQGRMWIEDDAHPATTIGQEARL